MALHVAGGLFQITGRPHVIAVTSEAHSAQQHDGLIIPLAATFTRRIKKQCLGRKHIRRAQNEWAARSFINARAPTRLQWRLQHAHDVRTLFPSMCAASIPAHPADNADACPGLRRVATRFAENMKALPSLFLIVPVMSASMLTFIGYQSTEAPQRWRKTVVFAARRFPFQMAPVAGVICCTQLVVVTHHEISERGERTEPSVMLAFPAAGALLDVSARPRAIARNTLAVGVVGAAVSQYFRTRVKDESNDENEKSE